MDWQKIMFGDEDLSFIIEIAFRSFIMFFLVFFALRIMGKREVRQLSIIELLIIIVLGSAAGDPLIYKNIGIVNSIVSFLVVFILYWTITKLITRSEKIEILIEGKPIYIIREGRASKESFKHKELGIEEFFAALRSQNIYNLGQVKAGILEPNGAVSLLLYNSNEIRPGLPIWPDELVEKTKQIMVSGLYACANCGNVKDLIAGDIAECDYCLKSNEWVPACEHT